jgi:hypothetical protein
MSEEIAIDGRVDDGEDVIFIVFFRGDLVDVANEGDVFLEMVKVYFFIDLYLLFEVVGQFKQRNIVVVLLYHEMNKPLFWILPALFVGSFKHWFLIFGGNYKRR